VACARLSGESEQNVKSRADEFMAACEDLSDKPDEVRVRATFYSRLAKYDRVRLRYYLLRGSKDVEASHLVSLLTDLPPHLIYDSYHNRKGRLSTCDGGRRDKNKQA